MVRMWTSSGPSKIRIERCQPNRRLALAEAAAELAHLLEERAGLGAVARGHRLDLHGLCLKPLLGAGLAGDKHGAEAIRRARCITRGSAQVGIGQEKERRAR